MKHAGLIFALAGALTGAFVLALAPLSARAADVKEVTSPGGVTAWLIEDHLNPVINMRFVFRGGAAHDPDGKEGLARLAAGLLDEGAAGRDSRAFQLMLADHAVTLRYDAGLDAFRGRLTMLTEQAETAFSLLGDSLTKPRFDEEPVERIRGQILSLLRQDEEDPDAQAGQALFAHVFDGHPYARPADGTVAGVEAVTREDLHDFAARMLALDTLVIGVAGDITPAQLRPLLDTAFAALPETAEMEEIEDAEPDLDGETIIIEHDVPQSSVVFADMGLKRSDPDFYAAYVMTHILGGGSFTARLYNEVREKRGLAYSIGSYLYAFDRAGLTVGRSGTQNERAAETVDVIRAEWRRMAEDGVTEDELETAKLYLTGSYPLRFTDTGAIASMLAGLQQENLPINYFDIRNIFIEAVTVEDIARTAERLLDADRMVFAISGKPQGLEEDDGFF